MVPAGLGPEMVIFLLRALVAGAPDLALAGLGPEIEIFCLNGLFTGAPEVAPARPGL